MSFPRDQTSMPGDEASPGPDAAVPGAEPAAPPRPVSAAMAAARARDAAIAQSILRLVAERGAGRSICPSEAAREVAAAEGRAEWHTLMGNVRRIAGRLQSEGRVEILRKGRPAAADVRGVIRLREARAGGAAGLAARDADPGPRDGVADGAGPA